MPAMSFTPSARKAYLAGRQAAQLMSVDPASAAVPTEYTAEATAYREGLRDEQEGEPMPGAEPPASPPPSPSSAPPAVPKPPATPKPAPPPITAKERRLQQYKKFYATLSQQPVEVVRDTAQRQISQIEQALKDAPFKSRTIQVDYAGITDRLQGARENFAAGERLKDKTDEASKLERRRSYLRAYGTAYTEAENLARSIGDESFLVLVLGNVVIPAVERVAETVSEAGKDLVNAGKDAVGQVGRTSKVIAYGLAGAAALALIAFATQRGKRR